MGAASVSAGFATFSMMRRVIAGSFASKTAAGGFFSSSCAASMPGHIDPATSNPHKVRLKTSSPLGILGPCTGNDNIRRSDGVGPALMKSGTPGTRGGDRGETKMKPRFIAATLTLVLLQGLRPALAQGQDFYKGKQVDLYIGYSVGGGYDIYGRLLARHLGRHIPGNPTVVPRNMPGAGSLTLANWLYGAGPKDGTVFGTIG